MSVIKPILDERPLPVASDAILKTWCLSNRQLCDVECLLTDVFFPLVGFHEKEDYDSVCHNMRLCSGALWPIPITLDVSEQFASQLTLNENIILTNNENTPVALLTISSIWQPDKEQEALLIFGSNDRKHPGVHYLFEEANAWYLGGKLTSISPITHYDFVQYRHTPAQLKQLFKLYDWSKVIAFQTRNPIYKAHFELTQRAAKNTNAHLLIHPVIGLTKPGDIEPVTRVKCYEKILEKYPKQDAMLSLLPLAMRMAGPKEALWHAIIRKNYGVTHFIVGRDHAGPGLNSQGMSFYEPYDAQLLLQVHSQEIGIEIVACPTVVYAKEKAKFLTIDEITSNDTIETISGTRLRRRLENRLPIPDWFSFPDIIQILQKAYPTKLEQGYTVFFTGLSGSGKSTLAKALYAKIREFNQRQVTLLDGDVVRKNLSGELGFCKTDRDTHIKRMGYVAAEITKHQGIAICAAIAPYEATRRLIREMVSQHGGFIEIHVSTPINICKKRDIKGLYKKAMLGLITGFTGVDDPYEEPIDADIIIDTSISSVDDSVDVIFNKLATMGFIKKASCENSIKIENKVIA
jgi:sulfate adenylyltransferase